MSDAGGGSVPSAAVVDFGAVSSALANYFDGLHQSDASLLKAIAHPDFMMYGVSEGALVPTTADDWFRSAAARPPTPELAAHDRIISIDSCLTNCAVAKVQVALNKPAAGGELLYTDFLVLLRIGGKWQMISKVYSDTPLAKQGYCASVMHSLSSVEFESTVHDTSPYLALHH